MNKYLSKTSINSIHYVTQIATWHARSNNTFDYFVTSYLNNFKRNSTSINLDTAMSSSVKLFQFLQGSYRRIGFHPSKSDRIPFNWKNVFIFLPILQLFISTSAFFLFKADSVFEFGTGFYAAITSLFTLIVFLIELWKIPDILKLIGNLENFIEKSEFNS